MAEHLTDLGAKMSGDHKALCEGLRSSLAQYQSMLVTDLKGEVSTGYAMGAGGDGLVSPLPNSVTDPALSTDVEAEIARIEQALRDNHCS